MTGLPLPLRLVRQVPPQRREVASETVTGLGGTRPSTYAGRAAHLTSLGICCTAPKSRSKATIRVRSRHVRCKSQYPQRALSGHLAVQSPCLLYRRKRTGYSMTSSALARSLGGTSRPRALAVLRLNASSYLVGACTGRSAGFSPLRMRST